MMDGLTYDTLAALTEPGSVSARLGWLRKAARYEVDEGYRPQAYNRLATAYRAAGVDDAAREVLLAKQRARTAARAARQVGTPRSCMRCWTECSAEAGASGVGS